MGLGSPGGAEDRGREERAPEGSRGAREQGELFAAAEASVSPQGCLITAMVLFTGTSVHPLLTLIITMEVSIFSFFIIIHTFAIQRYMPFILWPVTVSEGRRVAPEAGVSSQVLPERGLTSHFSAQTWALHLWVGLGQKRLQKSPVWGRSLLPTSWSNHKVFASLRVSLYLGGGEG